MEINKIKNGNELVIQIKGRLDSLSSPELSKEVTSIDDNIDKLVFDMKEMDYISSAGLRVLLAAQKMMNNKGEMKLCNVKDIVMEVFKVTNFDKILVIE